jgi:hypothetical protein
LHFLKTDPTLVDRYTFQVNNMASTSLIAQQLAAEAGVTSGDILTAARKSAEERVAEQRANAFKGYFKRDAARESGVSIPNEHKPWEPPSSK